MAIKRGITGAITATAGSAESLGSMNTGRDLDKHPKGLYVLFATEMWERFSFYTMVSMFTLYLRDPNEGLRGPRRKPRLSTRTT